MALAGFALVSFVVGRTRRLGRLVWLGEAAREASMLAVVRKVRRKKPKSGLGEPNIDGVVWE